MNSEPIPNTHCMSTLNKSAKPQSALKPYKVFHILFGSLDSAACRNTESRRLSICTSQLDIHLQIPTGPTRLRVNARKKHMNGTLVCTFNTLPVSQKTNGII